MSASLPETVDAWRMVTARRSFAGSLPLASLHRLAPSLAGTQGEVRYALQFDRDALGTAFIGVQAEAVLPLTCQRTLEVFGLPVRIDSRLGIIAREEDEVALPPGYEPLLSADGQVNPAEVIEDELILALPVVPLKPGSDAQDEIVWSSAEEEEPAVAPANPFAALAGLKK